MDIQTIAVSMIILAATLYGGVSPKTSCDSDCGCSSSMKTAKTLVKN
jgi:hypothetical protein